MAVDEPRDRAVTWPLVLLCASSELLESAQAVPFDVRYCGQPGRGFAIRYRGEVHAYLNRCSHVPIELDYQENRVFDASGQWLMCATHGATYSPRSGDCMWGPCRGGLVKIELSEESGQVHWHTSSKLQPSENFS